MRECLNMQLEALDRAGTARRRLASAWLEFKLAWDACEDAGWIAANRCEHDDAMAFFSGMREDSRRWLGERQSEVDSVDKALSMLVTEGGRATVAEMDADEFDEMGDMVARSATPEVFDAIGDESRAELMARRVVMGLPATPGGSSDAPEPDKNRVNRCAEGYLRRWSPKGGMQ